MMSTRIYMCNNYFVLSILWECLFSSHLSSVPSNYALLYVMHSMFTRLIGCEGKCSDNGIVHIKAWPIRVPPGSIRGGGTQGHIHHVLAVQTVGLAYTHNSEWLINATELLWINWRYINFYSIQFYVPLALMMAIRVKWTNRNVRLLMMEVTFA